MLGTSNVLLVTHCPEFFFPTDLNRRPAHLLQQGNADILAQFFLACYNDREVLMACMQTTPLRTQ